ncbi:hypothetical protein QBC47DRAFT_371903 [Echria macrotheca]|uniref:Uncharacterized protein n=1 Tax=Echria macrotheca TaxID=438768 RepID=A0AAJ0BJJ4_9PEZI|nr:hypothetical protein QBC47DRAFT_371903 [Echria macrotheca]
MKTTIAYIILTAAGVVTTVQAAQGQGQGESIGAPFPGVNTTGLSTEGVTSVVSVVSRFLTYCAAPTRFVFGTGVYEVSQPGTVTVTDCPCTITTVGIILLVYNLISSNVVADMMKKLDKMSLCRLLLQRHNRHVQ